MTKIQAIPARDETSGATRQDFNSPDAFINRELSQIAFNQRVLELAEDRSIPLLERLRYLCISCTNLDEFFEVRVAAMRQRQQLGAGAAGPDRLSPGHTMERIHDQVKALVNRQYHLFNTGLIPDLADTGIRILSQEDWTAAQTQWLLEYFEKELMPVLSPLGLDPVHPFPRILNKSLNFFLQLEGKDAFGREGNRALVRAPRSLPRLIRIPSRKAQSYDFVRLSTVLRHFMAALFPGMKITGCHQFRVTRNSELFIDEEETEDLARALQGELHERGFAEAVRLEVHQDCPQSTIDFLASHFGLAEADIFRCDGPVNLSRVGEIYNTIDRPELKYAPFSPRVQAPLTAGNNLFAAIREHDLLLHHPYDNFSSILELLRQAARDPHVLAIKQTLYRTGSDSALVNYLIEAARAGKDVTVVVELRARFDEEANLNLATRLQEAGVQVVYGVVGHKTHAKMLLIVRREGDTLQRYLHLGTGNYHPTTANTYTDFGLLTANPEFGEDVHHLFQQLSGLGKVMTMNQLLHAPFTLHKALLKKIRREAKHAQKGRPAAIEAKLNALTDPSIIRALYRASCAGVNIRLLVRGACCLRPGVKGLSENIEVRSVLGRFLEHARVYYFANNDSPQLYLSSADWMERNLYQRVEVAFPILQPDMAQTVYHQSLHLGFHANVHAWRLQTDGTYKRLPEEDNPLDMQSQLLQELCHR